MGEEARVKAVAVACSLAAASPGSAVELDKPPLAVLCLGEVALQLRHVPLPTASPTPLPPSSAGRDFTGLQLSQGRL